MELPDFLKAYADPKLRDDIPEVSYSASVVTDEEVAQIMNQGGKHSEEHVAAQIAMGDALIEDSKEIQALGAFNSADRTVAMDLLGFKNSWFLPRIRWLSHSIPARKNRWICDTVLRERTTATWLSFVPPTTD